MEEVRVCAESELGEGAARIVEIRGIEIAVIRHQGAFFAYRNLCPHQGGPACEGIRIPAVRDRIDEQGGFCGQTFDDDDPHIVCPWHGYEFHLKSGEHVADPAVRLRKHEVVLRDDV